jgi:hypothetical protein
VAKTSCRRKAFRDIVHGFSPEEYRGELIYIKHLSPHDQVELEDLTEIYQSQAEERGLPTEAQMLDFLEKEGSWTREDDKKVEAIEGFISLLQSSKAKIVLKSAIDQQNELILKEEAKLSAKLQQKDDLIGNTCERYAQQRTNDFYILKSFYSDRELKYPLMSEGEYNELTAPDLAILVRLYNDVFASFSEESIQYLILEEFYQPYLSFSDDSMQFYGIPFCLLTYNQVRMIVYTRIFKSIYENNNNIPEKVRNDPKALLDYGSISDEEKEKMKERFESSDGATLVGAKKEDYEYLGIKPPSGGVDLHAAAKKKGGSLNMEDMMKLSGV